MQGRREPWRTPVLMALVSCLGHAELLRAPALRQWPQRLLGWTLDVKEEEEEEFSPEACASLAVGMLVRS